MNPTVPARVQARSRHDRRLESMTIGAAALGIVATVGFGYAAALTYSGTTSVANAANQPVGNGDAGRVPYGDSGYNGQTGQSGSTSQGGTVNPYFGGQYVAPPTTSRHHGFAVGGGS